MGGICNYEYGHFGKLAIDVGETFTRHFLLFFLSLIRDTLSQYRYARGIEQNPDRYP